ncbi:MAG: hypothetical protein QNJ45_23165 [Ardenticatenaceae bacterium]|nr:hypothetical protein [Ardenticatenaceae bacterium]
MIEAIVCGYCTVKIFLTPFKTPSQRGHRWRIATMPTVLAAFKLWTGGQDETKGFV